MQDLSPPNVHITSDYICCTSTQAYVIIFSVVEWMYIIVDTDSLAQTLFIWFLV